MKEETYSVYEAKAKLSQILRKVMRNKRVVITHRGVPVAEVVPIEKEPESLEDRMKRLEREGILGKPRGPIENFKTYVPRPGALERFLREREEDD